MNMSADEKLHMWLCDLNGNSVGTQEHILDNWDNEVITGDQGDINPDNNKKSRIEEVQDEIASDENSPETEIILGNNQVDENYKLCTQCGNSADLNTCPSCHNHYCAEHWDIGNDQCNLCVDLGFELDKKASEAD